MDIMEAHQGYFLRDTCSAENFLFFVQPSGCWAYSRWRVLADEQ